jgi:Domain of unknown function (DUF4340)
MTNYKTTILLAIIFAGLGVYLYTIEVPTIEQETAQQEEVQRLLPFDYRDITELKITTSAEAIRMTRDDRRRWSIVEPVQAKGDSREVENILRALEIGKISRVVQQEEQDLSQYGLDSPNATIQLIAGDQSETLHLGGVAPLTSTLYGQRQSDKQILLTTLLVSDFRRKTLFTFRYKDVMFFDRTQVERIQLNNAAQQMTLHRVASIHGPTGNWRFSEPFEGPADKTSVGLLLMALENLSAIDFIDGQTEKDALLKQFPEPFMTATVHTGQRGHLVTFFQRAKDTTEEAYAMTSADQPIYKILPAVLQGLPKGAFDLQDKRLFGMEMAEIGLLTVTTPSKAYTLVQQHGEWFLDGAPDQSIDQQEMKLFVSRVVDLPAELSVSLTEEHLNEYGLTSPAITIVGVDTKGRQRGYLALGKSEGGLVYAMGSGLPGVYQARSIILTQLPTL